MGYLLLVGLVGAGLAFVGGLIAVEGMFSEDGQVWFILGMAISFFGYLIIVAGLMGVQFKIIADAVCKGNQLSTFQQSSLKVVQAPSSSVVYPQNPF